MSFGTIHGIILATIRSIHLQRPARGIKSHHHLLAGRRIGLEWWTTWKTILTAEKLARLVGAENASLSCADESRLAELFIDFLKDAVTDGSLFDTWAIFRRSVPTLYEAIIPQDKMLFADGIYRRWLALASADICNWLVVIPLEGVETIAVDLTPSLALLPASDGEQWNQMRRRFPGLVDFDPTTGGLDDLSCFSRGLPQKRFSWAVFETRTSAEEARTRAADATRTFLSIAFSAATSSDPSILSKTGWTPTDRAVQFAETSDGKWVHPGIGNLVPPMSRMLVLSKCLVDEIKRWYSALQRGTDQRKQRVITASHFLHQALLANETQQFIWYFIVLDALFGERGRVERMILCGIRQLTADHSWVERCRLLFDLRSALLHGEVINIRSWRDLPTYRRLFHADPLADVQQIALTALRQFPFAIA